MYEAWKEMSQRFGEIGPSIKFNGREWLLDV